MRTAGERIRRLRENKDWNQIELAKKANINNSVLSRIEASKRPIEDELLVKFAEIFNVSTDYLLGRTDIHSSEPNHSQQLDKRLRELLSDPEMLVAFKGLEDMTDEEKEGLITYLEGMKVRRERKGK